MVTGDSSVFSPNRYQSDHPFGYRLKGLDDGNVKWVSLVVTVLAWSVTLIIDLFFQLLILSSQLFQLFFIKGSEVNLNFLRQLSYSGMIRVSGLNHRMGSMPILFSQIGKHLREVGVQVFVHVVKGINLSLQRGITFRTTLMGLNSS